MPKAFDAVIVGGGHNGLVTVAYLVCGACTHPGGGVMGAAGHNAAREILRDFRRGARS